MTGRPWLVILGGINGAGKSTLADELAQDPRLAGVPFLNPDHATEAFKAADPPLSQRAAEFRGLRAVAKELDRLLAAQRTLVTEAVLANEAYVRLCRSAKAAGYGIRLLGREDLHLGPRCPPRGDDRAGLASPVRRPTPQSSV